jgi:alpha-galactosidase
MDFGLWVEPEMVNLDSDLAREHPDWVLGPAAGAGPPARHQHVLDLANPEAFSYLLKLTTALFGQAGIEQDLTACSPEELDRLTAWSALYRELRPLLHYGRTVSADPTDPALLLHGVVAHVGSSALYSWARLATSAAGQSGRIGLPGLTAGAHYRLRVRTDRPRRARSTSDLATSDSRVLRATT